MQIHSDCQKLRRFALHLLAAGDLRRYVFGHRGKYEKSNMDRSCVSCCWLPWQLIYTKKN